jgi:hypothetical protein
MYPLMVARAFGKCIDATLIDPHPLGNAEFLADLFIQASDCKSTHVDFSLLQRAEWLALSPAL